ncbi:MAG: hypothetical protein H7Z73_11005 [Candidatus Saccharibacteria bacterium]|nr:hypothetical protein [Moraxellaceae bacterium]
MPDIASALGTELGDEGFDNEGFEAELICEKTENSSHTPKPTLIFFANIGVKNTDNCISQAANASKIPNFKGWFLNRISADNDLPYGNKMWLYSTRFDYFSLGEMPIIVHCRVKDLASYQ